MNRQRYDYFKLSGDANKRVKEWQGESRNIVIHALSNASSLQIFVKIFVNPDAASISIDRLFA